MNLTKLALKRPVATVMIVLLAVILGIYSATLLTVDLLPDLTFPVAVAYVTYPGAGPLEIERMVTRVLEEAVGSVNNVRSVRSTSTEETCFVIVEFDWGVDMDYVALEMRERIDQVQHFLPNDCQTPVVMKIDPSMMPFLHLSLSGTQDLTALKSLAEDTIKGRLERLEGVASVDVIGGQEREISVTVMVDRMHAYGIDLSQVVQTLRTENINLPGGRIEDGGRRLLVRSLGEFQTVSDIEQVRISSPRGSSVSLSEFATVESGLASETQRARLDGEPSIGLSVQKRPDANTVQVANAVLAEMSRLQTELPADVEFAVAVNSADFIMEAVNSVIGNAIIGAVLAVLILFLFLQSLRSTLVIAIAIPISIISSLALIYGGGLTVNLLTLGGLALGIGMLVDTAIVVLENIFRHRQAGKSAYDAADAGTNEVAGAVTASVLTTIGVFIPVVFMSGLASEIFTELALTVSFALFASLIVSLTVVPMVASRLFSGSVSGSNMRLVRFLRKVVEEDAKTTYKALLHKALNYRWLILTAATLLFIVSLVLGSLIGSDFMPATDTGEFIISIQMPQATLLGDTDAVLTEVESRLMADDRVKTVFATAGGQGFGLFSRDADTDRASIRGQLVPETERDVSVFEFTESLRRELRDIPGARIDVSVSNMFMDGMAGAPIELRVKGDELETLLDLSRDLALMIADIDGVRNVEVSTERGMPELRVNVDRQRASHYGLSAAQIGSTVRTAIQGDVATRVRADGEEIDVRIIADEATRRDIQSLASLNLLTATGSRVPLSAVATIETARGPVSIHRDSQVRTASVTADIAGRTLGEVSQDIEARLEQLTLPEGFQVELGGEHQQMTDAFSELSYAAVLAVLLVYVILAAQFESLLFPFVIMFAVPLALIGVIWSLIVTGQTLNIMSFLGIIMLAGIVVNNAIVMVDYLNQLRSRGMERRKAVLTAGEHRLRPILMTSLTTILALLPLALGVGAGAELQAPLATVVVGGLLFSTVLTLFVVPVLYEMVDDVSVRLTARRS